MMVEEEGEKGAGGKAGSKGMLDENENSHCAKPLTPIGGTPTRLGLRCFVSWSLEQDKGRKKGKGGESSRDSVYLSLQLPAMPVVPAQRIMMLDLNEGPVQ